MLNEDLRRPNVLKTIGEEAAKGTNWKGIARVVESRHGIKANYKTIQKVYESHMDMAIAGNEKLRERAEGNIINIEEQLKKINDLTNKLLDKYKDIEDAEPEGSKKVFVLIQLMREIQGHIIIQERLIERIKSMKPTINNVYLTKVIVQNIKNLEEQGIIKVLKKLPMIQEEEINENIQKS